MNKPFGKSELFLIDHDKLLAPVIKHNGHITFSNKKTDVFLGYLLEKTFVFLGVFLGDLLEKTIASFF